ncbi:MAG: sugar ABC transporter substrate-binding protein [Chloroflexi bacterium]|nr:sugar ABC transporter substrate-binding protein [Chloroflexota bacterium]
MASQRRIASLIGAAALAVTALSGGAGGVLAQDASPGMPGESIIATGDLTGKNICFAFVALQTEFWGAGHAAIVRSLEAANASTTELNAETDANKQLEQVRTCITNGSDAIFIIPQDGDSVLTVIKEANTANIPIAVFNRPPATEDGAAIVVVADNRAISKTAMEHMYLEAKKVSEADGGRKIKSVIMVGDLGDPNAVERRAGFYDVIDAYPELFEKPVEVETNWTAETGRAGLENAVTQDPNIDLLFTSSDFLYPQIQSVLEPIGKWQTIGTPGHVIMGGVDGDNGACQLMKAGYVDATAVQDLFVEADLALNGLVNAVNSGNTQPDEWIKEPGFALTQANIAERESDMWGCVIEPPSN